MCRISVCGVWYVRALSRMDRRPGRREEGGRGGAETILSGRERVRLSREGKRKKRTCRIEWLTLSLSGWLAGCLSVCLEAG